MAFVTRTVFLDLDGTLVDSAPGILGTLEESFDELGLTWPGEAIGTSLLGPPLYESLPPIVGEEASAQVLTVYRRRYFEHGLLKSTPYPGVEELLAGLAAAGARVALATSKAEPSARRIIENQGWTELFETITGDTVDAQRPTKAAVVGEAVRRLGGASPDAVMVGDRLHDVVGSRAHGIACLGAGWGYGEPGELIGAGAAVVYATPGELRDALLG
ncbi:MAG: HAD hydrolase-like protein [Pseudonocardia sp.]|nr:HAD hydrolase-like protein [Pseudonocardia sp.]